MILTFEPQDVEECVNISTMSDNIVEVEETLSVLLSNASPQNVTLMPNRASVAIIDRTGMDMVRFSWMPCYNIVSLSSTSGNSYIHSTIVHCVRG